MPPVFHDPAAARELALEVVARLRKAGFEALWAGVCVRDELLGRTPADYDVATSARPDDVRNVFGSGKPWRSGRPSG